MRLLIAYAAGFLSFLAPCGAFLLPGFFAYAFDERNRRITATWTFLAGFSTLFMPVGLGAYALGAQLALHRRELAWIGGLFMIAMGLLTLAGRGLAVAAPKALGTAGRDPRSLSTIYLLGVAFGFTVAGCSAPLLAITLAMAGTSKSFVMAALLLAAYVVGLGTPLIAISVAADKGKFAGRFGWLQRSWTFGLAGRRHEIRASSALAGAALVGLGAVFITSQGTFYTSSLTGASAVIDFNVRAAEFLSRHR